MVLSSCVTVDGWLTTFRISQKPIASFLRQSDQNQNQSKNKFFGFGLGQQLATAFFRRKLLSIVGSGFLLITGQRGLPRGPRNCTQP